MEEGPGSSAALSAQRTRHPFAVARQLSAHTTVGLTGSDFTLLVASAIIDEISLRFAGTTSVRDCLASLPNYSAQSSAMRSCSNDELLRPRQEQPENHPTTA